MPTGRLLVLRYAAFATLATLVNLATQRLIFMSGAGPMLFLAALGLGTLAGLVLKYFLDKIWIFNDGSRGLGSHGRKFSLYVAAGLVTTGIFWGMETLFWMLSHSVAMRELGAVVGLAIGYVVKYRLDRRFAFNPARAK